MNSSEKLLLTVVLGVGSLTACERAAAPRAPVPATAAALPSSSASPPASSAPPLIEAPPAEPDAEAPAPGAATEPAPVDPCEQAFHEARQELLNRGFAPTQDTAKWFYVSEDPESKQLALSIQMRQSADGAGTWYALVVNPGAPRTSPWKKSVKSVCCDDHAAREDNIKALSWERQRGTKQAEISVGYFGDLKDKDYLEQRELFVSVAKAAADRCLDAPAPAP